MKSIFLSHKYAYSSYPRLIGSVANTALVEEKGDLKNTSVQKKKKRNPNRKKDSIKNLFYDPKQCTNTFTL